jgi:cytochrome c oxidase subunit 3/cytochrome c oxidase subunit I+III
VSAASVENHRVLLAGREPGWWGMLLLIVTEATLFVYLLASYFYLREANATWPPGGIQRPELLVPAINTVILLSSSIPMWWAESGIRENKQIRLMLGLAISFGLGGLFLLIQGFEYARAGFTPQAHAYGSLFYTLTGRSLDLHLRVVVPLAVSVSALNRYVPTSEPISAPSAAPTIAHASGIAIPIVGTNCGL